RPGSRSAGSPRGRASPTKRSPPTRAIWRSIPTGRSRPTRSGPCWTRRCRSPRTSSAASVTPRPAPRSSPSPRRTHSTAASRSSCSRSVRPPTSRRSMARPSPPGRTSPASSRAASRRGTEPAGHAQFAVASIYENEKADPAAAIERYRKVAVEPWRGRAAQRIALMEAKALVVITERTFRSGETPRLKVATRNLERLTFTAYRIDPETYFRKKHTLSGVEALDIGLVAPDAEWTADVPGYARYRPIETTYELKKLQLPGVYVMKVSDDRTLQATTLVLGSDIDAIVKTSRDQVLVFAQHMKTGKGRPGARELVSDDEGIILDARTGNDGVLVRDWAKPLEPGQGANAVPEIRP